MDSSKSNCNWLQINARQKISNDSQEGGKQVLHTEQVHVSHNKHFISQNRSTLINNDTCTHHVKVWLQWHCSLCQIMQMMHRRLNWGRKRGQWVLYNHPWGLVKGVEGVVMFVAQRLIIHSHNSPAPLSKWERSHINIESCRLSIRFSPLTRYTSSQASKTVCFNIMIYQPVGIFIHLY